NLSIALRRHAVAVSSDDCMAQRHKASAGMDGEKPDGIFHFTDRNTKPSASSENFFMSWRRWLRFSGLRLLVNRQLFLAHIDEMVPCRPCAHAELLVRIFYLRCIVLDFVVPFRFFLFEFSAVGATELSVAPLHHRCQFHLIFLQSLRDRSVGSFVSNRF